MSALGQKPTFHAAVQESALPPKADIVLQCGNVRLVPIADIPERTPSLPTPVPCSRRANSPQILAAACLQRLETQPRIFYTVALFK